MATSFIPRQVKASWGIPANQNAEGELFVGRQFMQIVQSRINTGDCASC
jgi:hypothetical protein